MICGCLPDLALLTLCTYTSPSALPSRYPSPSLCDFHLPSLSRSFRSERCLVRKPLSPVTGATLAPWQIWSWGDLGLLRTSSPHLCLQRSPSSERCAEILIQPELLVVALLSKLSSSKSVLIALLALGDRNRPDERHTLHR
jgi:hypothetical protein